MSARANEQVETKQPGESRALNDASTGEVAPLHLTRPWRSLEIDTLRWRWQAAASQSHSLPPFEELALDSLGGMADNVALLQMDEAREFQILMAGKLFESWIGRPAHNLKVADLSIDRARALQDLFAGAVSESQPVQTVAHGVVDGSVRAYDLVAMPLSNRCDMRLFLVYMQEREQKFSLVEALFQATTEGLVALPSFATRRARRATSKSRRSTMARHDSWAGPSRRSLDAAFRKSARPAGARNSAAPHRHFQWRRQRPVRA